MSMDVTHRNVPKPRINMVEQLVFSMSVMLLLLSRTTNAGFLLPSATPTTGRPAHQTPLLFASDTSSAANTVEADISSSSTTGDEKRQTQSSIFSTFSAFLTEAQSDIISKIENHPSNPARVCFSSDPWENEVTCSRGLTRVIQPLDDEDCFIEEGIL